MIICSFFFLFCKAPNVLNKQSVTVEDFWYDCRVQCRNDSLRNTNQNSPGVQLEARQRSTDQLFGVSKGWQKHFSLFLFSSELVSMSNIWLNWPCQCVVYSSIVKRYLAVSECEGLLLQQVSANERSKVSKSYNLWLGVKGAVLPLELSSPFFFIDLFGHMEAFFSILNFSHLLLVFVYLLQICLLLSSSFPTFLTLFSFLQRMHTHHRSCKLLHFHRPRSNNWNNWTCNRLINSWANNKEIKQDVRVSVTSCTDWSLPESQLLEPPAAAAGSHSFCRRDTLDL